MLAAAAELRDAERRLWRLTPRWIRALLRPWWRAGWTNSDIRHALAHRPDVGGSVPSDRCPAEQLRHPDGWVRYRMRRWTRAGNPLPAPRIWHHDRAHVAARYGAGAAARLPYGAAELRVEHLAVNDQDRRAAAEQIVRQWARELHEARNARTPDEDVASPGARAAARAEYRSTHRIRRSGDTPAATPDAPVPAPDVPGTAYERALARARAEGRARRPRPRRRR